MWQPIFNHAADELVLEHPRRAPLYHEILDRAEELAARRPERNFEPEGDSYGSHFLLFWSETRG